jgi:pyruvate dehydrogenase E2 component (dihydrolipoamide acetyltransferase)
MIKEVRLPQLGETMKEGTIVSCLVKPGDRVRNGDVIFEIETDKATLEMESPMDGFVKLILAEVNQTLPVGEPLVIIGAKDEQVPQSFVDSLKSGGTNVSKDDSFARAAGPSDEIRATSDEKTAVRLGQTIPLSRIQKITAERMLQSKREKPCFYLTVKADVTNLVELRARLNQDSDIKISYTDFIIRAVATALGKYPVMTGRLDGQMIKLADSINIGLAIAVTDGLVAPILKDVSKKLVRQIARESTALIERARGNRLTPTDLEGGCVTVSNLGALGIDNFIPIVVPGQCSILGIGRITDTCVPGNGNILVRKLMNMTLSVDHKVANGAYAAQFLVYVRKLLEDASSFNI